MSDDAIPRGDAVLEVAWFVQHHRRALAAARQMIHAEAALDGAITVAHAGGDITSAAQTMKYELDDYGLLEILGSFRKECLADVEVTETPRLAALWAMLAVTLDHISDNLDTLVSTRSADGTALQEMRKRFRTISELFDSIIDDCVGDLAVRAGTAGDLG